MDMSDAPENAPTGPRRGSGRGGGGARRGGRKRAMAMADEDVAMGGTAESSTGNRPARKIRSSASHSASGPQHIKVRTLFLISPSRAFPLSACLPS